ncbi:MAG: LLM class flavin-dependent oxidoreductase [Chloroflexi bacterium]|nr:LLM class flavin-dependent oxidoreductase [Chloroflexota bacterium]
MKVRIGLGLGAWPLPERSPEALWELVDRCEALGIDSLWFSDRIVSPGLTLEPITLMAFIAARTQKMKFGTSALVLPVRNPVVLAKELATLDFLSNGRVLLLTGLGADDSRDFDACGVPKKERGRRHDESVALLRRLWSEEHVTFHGDFWHGEDVTIYPRPVQKGGPPLWIGGRSEAALRRAARLGDGWLASSVTPDEVASGIQAIRRYAGEYGRQIPEDHYGVYLPFYFAENPAEAFRAAGSFLTRVRPDVPTTTYCALGTPDQIRETVQQYLAAGATKFVVRPACAPQQFFGQLELLAREVIASLQTPFTQQELQERAGRR